jgi:hypothetical protein
VKHHIQQQEDDKKYDWQNEFQTLFCSQFKLVLAGPFVGKAGWQGEFPFFARRSVVILSTKSATTVDCFAFGIALNSLSVVAIEELVMMLRTIAAMMVRMDYSFWDFPIDLTSSKFQSTVSFMRAERQDRPDRSESRAPGLRT